MPTTTVTLTRSAWVDLGPAPCRMYVTGVADAAVFVLADTVPNLNATGFTVYSTYWQGFAINGPAQHIWGRALISSVSVAVVTPGTTGSVGAATISADRLTVSQAGVKPSSTVTVFKNGTQAGTAIANSSGAWSYTFGSALQSGDIVTYDAVLTSPPVTVAATTPAPAFTVAPTISPTSGTVGQAFTVADGTITNGTVASRQWNLNGSAISGATLTGYTSTAAGTLTCTVTATGTGGTTTATTAGVTVGAAAPTLQALALSSASATVGTAYSGTISNQTSGSTITLSGAGAAGLSVSGSTVSGAPTTAGVVNLIETLSGATNSPRTTSTVLTVNAAATPAPAFTAQPSISPSSGAVGQVFTVADGTITNGTVSARQWKLNGTAISGATSASYTSAAAGTLTCTVTATGSGGTASATTAGVTVSAAAATTNPLTPMSRVALTATPTVSPTNATSVTNLTNMAANKTHAVVAMLANTTHTIGLSIGAGTGRLLYLSTQVFYTQNNPTLTLTASPDGGTTNNALVLEEGISIDRGQFYTIPDGAQTLTLAFANKSAAQNLYLGLFQLPTDTTQSLDIWLLEGTSYEEYGFQPNVCTATIQGLYPSADPCVFLRGAAGNTSTDVKNFVLADVTNYPIAISRGVVTYSLGGNNFQSLRPYSANSQNSAVLAYPNDQQAIVSAIRAKSKIPPVPIGVSFRDYTAAPKVNDNANPENGSLPFNLNVIYPDALNTIPEWMDASLGVPIVDEYAYFLANRHYVLYGSTDGIHPVGSAQWTPVRDYRWRMMGPRFYGATKPANLYEIAVARLEGNLTQDNKNAAQELVSSLPASAGKTAYQNRINALNVPADTVKKLQVNVFDNAGGAKPSIYGWNHLDQQVYRNNASAAPLALTDTNGQATAYSIALKTFSQVASHNGTVGTTGGRYPDDIAKSYIYIDTGTAGETSIVARITGPANAVLPKVEVFASRSGSGTRPENVQVGSSAVQSVNVLGNVDTVLAFTNVALDASGIADITITQGSGQNFAYLNVVVLTVPVPTT